MEKQSKLGLVAKLIKKQTNRDFFSEIPIGTKFIIIKEIDTPAYDLTGYFINYIPHEINGNFYYTGHIEKGSWEIIGTVTECIEMFDKKYIYKNKCYDKKRNINTIL